MTLWIAGESHTGQNWFHHKLMVINLKLAPTLSSILLYFIGEEWQNITAQKYVAKYQDYFEIKALVKQQRQEG